jgi:hypothetical protein
MAAYFTNSGGGGALPPPQAAVISVTSSYSIQPTDYYIGCNGAGISLTLPVGSSVIVGKTFVIKDESGQASANRIIINVSGSNTIEGSSSVSININYMSLSILWTGAKWSVI